jgi:hypothetical protein
LLSFFYKDNPFYKLVEYLYVGASAGHAITLGWANIRDMGLTPMMKTGKIALIIPIVLGLMLYTRFSKSALWVSRIPMGFLVGIGTGMAIRGTIGSQVVTQIQSTILDPFKFNNLVIIVGVVTTLSYFFFTWKQSGIGHASAITGRMFMMVTFGAAFGNTVMGRMSLLIARLQYLYGNWLGIIKL